MKIYKWILILLSTVLYSQERRIDLSYNVIYKAMQMPDDFKNNIKRNVEKNYSPTGDPILIEEMQSSITYYYFDKSGYCNYIEFYASQSMALLYIAYLEKKYLSINGNKWSFTRDGKKYYISYAYENLGKGKTPIFKIFKN